MTILSKPYDKTKNVLNRTNPILFFVSSCSVYSMLYPGVDYLLLRLFKSKFAYNEGRRYYIISNLLKSIVLKVNLN